VTAVLFPDVEQVVIDGLSALLATHGHAGVPVSTRVPNPRPPRFVRVLVTGGARLNLVADAPSVTVEGWGETETAALNLTRTARACMELLRGTTVNGHVVYGGRDFGSPANLPDPDSAQHRYTTTGTLPIRGVALT